MTNPLSQHKVEKNDSGTDWLTVEFNNIDGSPFIKEVIVFEFIDMDGELQIDCQLPSSEVQEYSCEAIYKQDIIETIQDWYKMKVKEFNWIKR